MEYSELCEIFGNANGIPSIAGMYIGLDEEDCFEIVDELRDNRYSLQLGSSFSFLVHDYKLEFDYASFGYYGAACEISVSFPLWEEHQRKQLDQLKNFLLGRYHYTKVEESVEYNSSQELIECDIVISNEYYQYSLSLSGDKKRMIVEISAIEDDYGIYSAFNEFLRSPSLFAFFQKSTYFCSNDNGGPLSLLLPFKYGVPSIHNVYIGSEYDEANHILDLLGSRSTGNHQINDIVDDYNLSFDCEGDVDRDDVIGSMTIQIPTNSEYIPGIINYIKSHFLIESATYYVDENEDWMPENIEAVLDNEYFHASLKKTKQLMSNEFYELRFEKKKEVSYEVYQALYLIADNYKYYMFLKEIEAL